MVKASRTAMARREKELFILEHSSLDQSLEMGRRERAGARSRRDQVIGMVWEVPITWPSQVISI